MEQMSNFSARSTSATGKRPPSNLEIIANALKPPTKAAAESPSKAVDPHKGLKRSSLSKEVSFDLPERMEGLGLSPSKSIQAESVLKRRSTDEKRPMSEDSERFFDCETILDDEENVEPPSKKTSSTQITYDEQARLRSNSGGNQHLVSKLQGKTRLRYWDSADHNMSSQPVA